MKITATLVLLFITIHLATAQPPTSFAARGAGGGGSLFFPRINPANNDEFYVACDMSEMFHSTDYGNTYSQLHFTKLPVMNVSTYEFTSNPNIAYSNYNDGNSGYPVVTMNGGNTWTQLPGFDANLGGVYTMKANYNNPGQLLMGYYDDIVISNDSGNTFSLVRHGSNLGAGLIMGGVFFDGINIFIGTNEGLLYSVDGGISFMVMTTIGIPPSSVIWNMAGAKTGATVRFTCITIDSLNAYNGIMPWNYYALANGVYTMDDAIGTWVSASALINFSNDYVMYAAMAENNINTIYLGGHDEALGAPLVYKSSDGGATWINTLLTTNNANVITGWQGYQGDKSWGWDETCFGISVAPNDANRVMFGNYSDVHLSSDGGATWKQAYVSNADEHPANAPTPTHDTYHSIGLENTSCWQVEWESATTMLAAYSDIGMIRSTDGGSSWGYTYTGLTVNSTYRIAKQGAVLYAATSNIHDMYQSTRLADAQLDASDGQGKIQFSVDSGATWQLLHSFGHPVFWIALDPNNPDRAYASVIHYSAGAGVGGVYRCDNLSQLASSTWTLLPDPPRTEKHPASIVVLNDGKAVCTFSGRRNASGAFTPSSGTFLYNPVTNVWTDVSDSGMVYWTKDIVIDEHDATQNTWYVSVFSGWGGAPNGKGGLYKTTNRGATWTKLTGTQFDRVTSITFNPGTPDEIYLTTETQGLWNCSNINAMTPVFTLVNSYPFRQPERVFFNPYNPTEMWVGSFGNGMKTGTLLSTGIAFEDSPSGELSVYPNPSQGKLTIENGEWKMTDGKLTMENGELKMPLLHIYNVMGDVIYTAILNERKITIDTKLSPGIYFVEVSDGFTKQRRKVVVIDN